MTAKNFKVQKATGVSVEEFYDAQDAAMQETNVGKRANLLRYSCLILARVDPRPSLEEFKDMLDEEIEGLVQKCKDANPRHFPAEQAEPTDQKKSEI